MIHTNEILKPSPILYLQGIEALTKIKICYMRIFMRTSLEIPDPLFKEAKRFALETDTTLKSLVAEGLELLLQKRGQQKPLAEPDSKRLPKVRPKGTGLYSISSKEIDCILAEEEATHYGNPR